MTKFMELYMYVYNFRLKIFFLLTYVITSFFILHITEASSTLSSETANNVIKASFN